VAWLKLAIFMAAGKMKANWSFFSPAWEDFFAGSVRFMTGWHLTRRTNNKSNLFFLCGQ